MALKTETKHIGQHSYTVTQLDAVRGRKMATRIARILGPALDGISKDAGAALGTALKNLSDEDVDYVCETFAASSTVSGGEYGSKQPSLESVFAVHFAGKYGEMLQWLAFCFKVNFESFLEGAGPLLGRPAQA